MPIGKVGIFIGPHPALSVELTNAIDSFCQKYGAVVYCDHTSNYKGAYRFQYPLVLSQDNWKPAVGSTSTLIHMGGVSGAYTQPFGQNLWRVNPDGMIRSVYGLPDAIFEMREIDFSIIISKHPQIIPPSSTLTSASKHIIACTLKSPTVFHSQISGLQKTLSTMIPRMQ